MAYDRGIYGKSIHSVGNGDSGIRNHLIPLVASVLGLLSLVYPVM